MDQETHTLSTDVALRLLADRRRRQVLGFLIEYGDGVAAVEELAAAVASGLPGDGRDGTGNGGPLRQVTVELRHVHLPKLDEEGVVDYDPRSDTARYRPHDRLETLHAFVAETFDGE